MAKKLMTYKGWVIAPEGRDFLIYSKEEWAYGKGYRTPEWYGGSIQECKDFIDSY